MINGIESFSNKNKTELVNLCHRRLKGTKKTYSAKTVPELTNLLQAHNNEPRDPRSDLFKRKKKHIIYSSFMNPLTGKGKATSRIGLDNEKSMLTELLKISKTAPVLFPDDMEQSPSIVVEEIYRPGMVMLKNKPYCI